LFRIRAINIDPGLYINYAGYFTGIVFLP